MPSNICGCHGVTIDIAHSASTDSSTFTSDTPEIPHMMHVFRLIMPLVLALTPVAARADAVMQDSVSGDDCRVKVTVRSNLLYDAILTPSFGLELSLTPHCSVGLEGVYAWWSNDRSHRYWRIRGVWLDVNYWFGGSTRVRALTGHHAGLYMSWHDYDFEFGGKGWQSPRTTFGFGLSYGYSLRLNRRLNLDFFVRAGYSVGHVISYEPQCGQYVCIDRYLKRYFGITGLGVTLVWFPGRGNINNPGR